jgi:hypothetical protein
VELEILLAHLASARSAVVAVGRILLGRLQVHQVAAALTAAQGKTVQPEQRGKVLPAEKPQRILVVQRLMAAAGAAVILLLVLMLLLAPAVMVALELLALSPAHL